MSTVPDPATRIVACPQCRKSVVFDSSNPWRPFCSERCRMVDLGAWATESHRIAGESLQSEQEPDEHQS